jgi:hypothetical protein
MSRRLLVASFDDEHALLAAVRHARESGHRVVDVFSPYPVHGLDESQGLRPSRIPWATLGFGLAGLAGGIALQAWTSATDWPLDVGGKPLLSWPAFVPVAFELVVLLAGLGTVAAFLLVDRRRGRPAGPHAARATDDRFLLTLDAGDATYDAARLRDAYRARFGATEVEEVLADDEPEGGPR